MSTIGWFYVCNCAGAGDRDILQQAESAVLTNADCLKTWSTIKKTNVCFGTSEQGPCQVCFLNNSFVYMGKCLILLMKFRVSF